MARTKRAAAPTQQAEAEQQAALDAALAEALQNRDGAPASPPRRSLTLGENFVNVVELLKQARRSSRLSEATLVKLWELNLMWALNNRGTVSPEVYPDEPEFINPPEGGDESEPEEAPDLPEPNERITAAEEN